MLARFPVALLSRDCGEVTIYEDLAELEQSVEVIDVENQEYSGWDDECFEIRLQIISASLRTGWLQVIRASPSPQKSLFYEAVIKFGESEHVSILPEPSETPMAFLRKIEGAISVRPRARRNAFRIMKNTVGLLLIITILAITRVSASTPKLILMGLVVLLGLHLIWTNVSRKSEKNAQR